MVTSKPFWPYHIGFSVGVVGHGRWGQLLLYNPVRVASLLQTTTPPILPLSLALSLSTAQTAKVGTTKADRKTRRPEWNQNFLVRSDLADPDPPQDDDTSNPSDVEGDLTDDDDDCHENDVANRNNTNHSNNTDNGNNHQSASCPSEAAAVVAKEDGVAARGWIGRGRALTGACGRCGACRRRGIEVVLEVWDEYTRDEDEEGDGEERRGSTSEPNDLFGELLWLWCRLQLEAVVLQPRSMEMPASILT